MGPRHAAFPRRLLIPALLLATALGVMDSAPARDLTPLEWTSLVPANRTSLCDFVPAQPVERSDVRIQFGDNPDWARPEFDDSGWKVTGPRQLPSHTGIYWIRFRVRAVGRMPSGFFTTAMAAYEAYWDGQPVGGVGRPGNSAAEEVPGPMDNAGTIPAELRAPGEHVVALRMSTYRSHFPSDETAVTFLSIDLDDFNTMRQRRVLYPTAAAGGCLMLAIAAGLMWLLGVRRPAVLRLAGLCLGAILTEAWFVGRLGFGYRYDWYYLISTAGMAAQAVTGVLMVAFVTAQFRVPQARWLYAAMIPIAAVAHAIKMPLTSHDGSYFLTGCAGLAVGAALWAVTRRRLGARPAAAGLIVSAGLLFSDPVGFAGLNFIWTFLPTAAGFVSALAIDLRAERERAQEARITSARLELELLRKNLQPHFLLNTLAVLTEIVERDPPAAVKLIADLADEFRSVSRVSAQKLIPLGQELELCRAHLRVMSIRTGRVCRLDTDVDETVAVPPAVFLTLIENGFAHQRVNTPETTFRLAMERTPDGTMRYTFVSPGELEPEPGRPAGGTGLRYVKARLEESFPGRWMLAAEPAAEGWVTTVMITAAERNVPA